MADSKLKDKRVSIGKGNMNGFAPSNIAKNPKVAE
jgi:hypothetical protein